MKLAVIDLETSGLLIKDHVMGDESPHTPGRHPDCILEIGLVVLDAETLVEEYRQEWLVLPPNVTDSESFARWENVLREKNKFVFDLHAKYPLLKSETDASLEAALGSVGLPTKVSKDTYGKSLLMSLRAAAAHERGNACRLSIVERQLVSALCEHASPEFQARAREGKVHPGNSDLMFTGNSIANLDIPMLRLWMPEVHKLLSYRILDVSVLRTFYQDIAKIPIPQKLADDIKSGGGGHRALADAVFCAQSLRELVSYTRFGSYGENGADGPNSERSGLGGFGGTFEQLTRENERLRESLRELREASSGVVTSWFENGDVLKRQIEALRQATK